MNRIKTRTGRVIVPWNLRLAGLGRILPSMEFGKHSCSRRHWPAQRRIGSAISYTGYLPPPLADQRLHTYLIYCSESENGPRAYIRGADRRWRGSFDIVNRLMDQRGDADGRGACGPFGLTGRGAWRGVPGLPYPVFPPGDNLGFRRLSATVREHPGASLPYRTKDRLGADRRQGASVSRGRPIRVHDRPGAALSVSTMDRHAPSRGLPGASLPCRTKAPSNLQTVYIC